MKKRYCSVPGCGELHSARGWCQWHYARWHYGGDVLADLPICGKGEQNRGRVCSVTTCDRFADSEHGGSHGWCSAHASRVRLRGDLSSHIPLGELLITHRVCAAPGCGKRHHAQGWCHAHYTRWRSPAGVQLDIPIGPPGRRKHLRNA